MAQHIWTVIASKAIRDAESDTLSLIDIVEGITIGFKPQSGELEKFKSGKITAIPREVAIASLWERSDYFEPESHELKYTILGPNNKKLGKDHFAKLDLNRSRRAKLIQQLQGLPVSGGEGTYRIEVRIKSTTKSGKERWVLCASVPYDIKLK